MVKGFMLHRIVLSAAVLLLAGSCDRTITSKDPETTLPTAPVQPAAKLTQIGATQITLSWTVSSTSGIVRYRVYQSEGTTQSFIVKDSTSAQTITIAGLSANQQYQFQVASVNANGIEGLRSGSVTVSLGIATLSINSNAVYTNSRTVTVAVSAAGAANLMLSEDPAFAGAINEPFVSQKSFTLSSGEGSKRVFARLTYSGGAVSDTISDGILLDTRSSIDSVFFSPSGPFTSGDTILFGLASSDLGGVASVSFPQVSQLRLYDDGSNGDNLAGDGRYQVRYVVPVNLSVDNALVTGAFTDEAGNAAPAASAAATLSIRSAPVAVQLATPFVEPSFRISLGWTESPATDFSSYRLYRRTTQPVTTSSTLIETITGKSTLSAFDTTAAAGTKYYYRLFVFNRSGLSTGSNTDSATTPANVAPLAVTLAGSFTDSTNVRLSWTKSTEPDFASYRIYRAVNGPIDVNDQLVTIINGASTDSYTDFVGGNSITYRVFVFDRFGLSTGSNEVIVVRQ